MSSPQSRQPEWLTERVIMAAITAAFGILESAITWGGRVGVSYLALRILVRLAGAE